MFGTNVAPKIENLMIEFEAEESSFEAELKHSWPFSRWLTNLTITYNLFKNYSPLNKKIVSFYCWYILNEQSHLSCPLTASNWRSAGGLQVGFFLFDILNIPFNFQVHSWFLISTFVLVTFLHSLQNPYVYILKNISFHMSCLQSWVL